MEETVKHVNQQIKLVLIIAWAVDLALLIIAQQNHAVQHVVEVAYNVELMANVKDVLMDLD